MHRSLDPIFSRILVGADGSTQGEEAVRQAARLAALTGAELDVAFVSRGADAYERVEDADVILEECLRLARKEDVEATTHVLVGDVAPALRRHADVRWCDLICVGSDGGALEGRPFARVAADIVRDASSSVLVARWRRDESCRFPGLILCALDGAPDSEEAGHQASRIAAPASGELELLHAVDIHRVGAIGWTARDDIAARAVRRARLEALAEGVEARPRAAIGRPGPVIVRAALDADADLIVVGSRDLKGMRRLRSRSVSEWVARYAACSVLVARPRAR
jgi:nucleotide-binding universal stress UspA family protein